MTEAQRGGSRVDAVRSPWLRGFDLVATAIAVLATAYLVVREPLPGRHDLIGTGLAPDLFFVLLAGCFVLGIVAAPRRRSAVLRVALRLAACFGIFLLAGMAWSRLSLARHEAGSDEVWPPRVAIAERASVTTLVPIDRTEWALRLALHAAGTAGALDRPPAIPAAWPWPAEVEVAVRATQWGTELWTHFPGSEVSCHALVEADPAALPDSAFLPVCQSDRDPPADLRFGNAERAHDPIVETPPPIGVGWPQHRRDAVRTGAAEPKEARRERTGGWRTPLRTPVRASAGAVNGHVLVGGHATGLVASLALEDGSLEWLTHAPNWVHQEPVSDGAVVVVGFGDNNRSFRGLAPSGVAAFDLATGARIWTAFDESSVMTSPILADSLVIYVTAAGLLKSRDRATGELRSVATLPGGVIMGPPLLHGDTIVAALDIDVVCAYLRTGMRELWCRELPWLRMMGHSSPAVAGGRLLLSAVATARTIGLGDLGDLRPSLLPGLARSVLFPLYWEVVHAGQVYLALDLATGEPLWRSPFFARRRLVDGHTAGTPTMVNTTGLVVLPIADTVVAFELATGRPRWTAGAHAARGPPLIVDNLAVVAGRDGVIEVRDLGDGALRCTIRRDTGWDRAGPAVAGGLVIVVDLRGMVEAIPLDALMDCEATEGPNARSRR